MVRYRTFQLRLAEIVARVNRTWLQQNRSTFNGVLASRMERLVTLERATRGRLFGMEGDWQGELAALQNSSSSTLLDQAAAARAADEAMLTGTAKDTIEY